MNSSYGLVPQALRETGRTFRDILSHEATGRVSKAQMGLARTKLGYDLQKEQREVLMNTPNTIENLINSLPVSDVQKQQLMNTPQYKFLDESKTITTLKELGSAMNRVKEKKAKWAHDTELLKAEQIREDELLIGERAHEINVAGIKAGAKKGLTPSQEISFNQKRFEYENTEMKKWEETNETNFKATPEEKAFQRKIFGEQYRKAILGSEPTGEDASSRQTTLRKFVTEFTTKYPKATDEQISRYVKLQTGAHGEGKDAEKLWDDLMGELDKKPKPKPKPKSLPRKALTPGEMTAGAKNLPQVVGHFFRTLPTERHGLARRQR